MAQDELTRLQNSLTNYQSKNTSGQYNSTVANIENKINNLKGQAEFGSKPSAAVTSTSGATTPAVKTTTNQYDFTKTPAQNSGAGLNVSKSPTGGTVVGGRNTPKVVNSGVVPGTGVAGTTGVAVPAGAGGVTTPTGTPAGAVTPAAVTPAPPATYSLRDVATGAGMTIGNNGNIPLINGNQIDPAKAGLTLVDGRWQGTAQQLGGALGVPVELRGALEGTGRTVAWDPQTGRTTVNGIPIDTGTMVNIGGRYYTTQEGIDSIVARTGGQIPLGTELGDIAGKAKDEAGLVQGGQTGEVVDNSLAGQLQDALNQNQELQEMINQIKDTKIPQADFSQSVELLKQFQAYKAPFDDQIKQILKETFKDFEYNPDNDPLLSQAIKYADRSMMEEMNRRGILGSSITVDNMRLIREDLLPKYQDMAFQKYNEQLNNNFKRIDVLQSLNATDYERYKNFVSLAMDTAQKISQNTVDTVKANLELMQTSLTNQIALNKANAEVKAEAYKNALLKFKEVGYVDNEVALLTGYPVGTISKEVEMQMMQRYDEYNKIGIQLENQLGLMEKGYEIDMRKVDQTQKQKDKESSQQAKVAKIYAGLLNMSGTDALKEVYKNYADLSDYLGKDLLTLIGSLEAKKAAEEKSAMEKKDYELKKRSVDIDQQNANRLESSATEKQKSMSTADKNLYIAEASRTYKSYPTQKAIEYLIQDADGLITDVGVVGYKQIWDQALGEAIKRGDKNAQSFSNYFKAPKQESKNPVDKLVNGILSKYGTDLSSILAE